LVTGDAAITVMRLIQINLNNHGAAQDLLVRNVIHYGFDVACVSEPYSVPRSPHWLGCINGKAAVYVGSGDPTCVWTPFKIDRNYAAIKCKQFYFFSVYIAPSENAQEFHETLDNLDRDIRLAGGQCIIAGDFNAKSAMWGDRHTDWRGLVLERWAASLDLGLANVGSAPTCVHRGGYSTIDLTWSTPDISPRIFDWRVLSDEDSLSDHRYIVFGVGGLLGGAGSGRSHYTRWNTKSMDTDLFREVLSWVSEGGFRVDSVEGASLRIADMVTSACGVTMRKLKFRNQKRGVYWWNEEVACVKKRCTAVRRLLTRRRRRGGDCAELEELYRRARRDLCTKIKKAKYSAWESLIQTLDEDPWGLPYKLVMDRLRRSGPTMLERLEPDVAERLLRDLFPSGEAHDPIHAWVNREVELADCTVTLDEVISSIKGRRRGGCPAPGPDGLSLAIWKKVPRGILEALAALFSRCLLDGVIPRSWKRSILVLIPKGTFDVDNPKARPICLLDDVGKLFERILSWRLKTHLDTLPRRRVPIGRLVSGAQYGFREGLSTVDALEVVTSFVRDRIRTGGVVLAVSLDIKNAFNSLLWGAIRWALGRGGYPDYLRRILDHYLYDRHVEYSIGGGLSRSRAVDRGVPQGSVLGPLLWSIAYDHVLRTYSCRPGCYLVGYADDTLVLGTAKTVEAAQSNINCYLNYVIRRIEFLGLEVAPQKTEAVLFRGNRRLTYTDPMVRIKDSFVKTGPVMKYLGVLLDCRLNFRAHFKYLGEKVAKVTRALNRLMPNLRGPMERKRRLYASIVESVILYAAPVWAGSLNSDLRRLLRQWQRPIAIRVCCAYRSVSFDSATLLARLIPYELLAAERDRVYRRITDAKREGLELDAVVGEIKIQERAITQRQWVMLISRPGAAGVRLRDAVLPCLPAWMCRRWGGITFRMTQILTGHGCFGTFLQRIGKTDTAICPFCNLDDDSSEHTLWSCAEWRTERTDLIGVIGPDLSLAGVIRAITDNKESWSAFSRFAETVMRRKEDAERVREAENLSPGPFDPG